MSGQGLARLRVGQTLEDLLREYPGNVQFGYDPQRQLFWGHHRNPRTDQLTSMSSPVLGTLVAELAAVLKSKRTREAREKNDRPDRLNPLAATEKKFEQMRNEITGGTS